jgi:hypothetical protein
MGAQRLTAAAVTGRLSEGPGSEGQTAPLLLPELAPLLLLLLLLLLPQQQQSLHRTEPQAPGDETHLLLD